MSSAASKKIAVCEISKRFKIGFQKADSALARLLNSLLGREQKKTITVLDNISLEIFSGEKIGLIGNNGSGKSTLLRLIADIYQPDGGKIEKFGEILYINGFGLGLKPRLTMRDNIFLMGSIMGLSYREIKKRLPEIIEFSELGEFLNTKVYQFSSGMMHRLCFSTTIFCLAQKAPEVILLDEVFSAGGDINFQSKALAKMEEFIHGGSAIVLVSHQLELVEKYCDRVVWLEKGRIKKIGAAAAIVAEYAGLNV